MANSRTPTPTLTFDEVHRGYDTSAGRIIQRNIYYEGAPQNEFVVDGARPAFKGRVKGLIAAAAQQKDHIIPFDAIQNDLAVMLNNFKMAAANGQAAVWQEVQDMTEAIFVVKNGNEYTKMTKQRQDLANDLGNRNWVAAAKAARTLLSSLNSSHDNVRLGNGSINQSIGENIDADFMQGVSTVPHGGLTVQGNTPTAPSQQLNPGTKYLRLNPTSEQILFNYQMTTTQQLSFVFNPNSNEQLSSLDAPQATANSGAVSGLPVIAFDPNNNQDPLFYN